MEQEKTITINEALAIAHEAGKKVSKVTLIKWLMLNKLGHQPAGNGGRWYIFENKFRRFIYGSDNWKGTATETINVQGAAGN